MIEAGTRSNAHATELESYYLASQWQLMARKLVRHRLAVASVAVLITLYFVGIFAEFFAPYSLEQRHVQFVFCPPRPIRFVDENGFRLRPFVYGVTRTIDPTTRRRTYTEDRTRKHSVRFFVHGVEYRLWGLLRADLHLFGAEEGGVVFLLGTDRLGRDMLSRIIYGARISLTIGLVGVLFTLIIGLAMGGISGYAGGAADTAVQRTIEVLRSFPTIPLWMALSAAMPPHWSPVATYFGITIILSLIGWTSLARVVRGSLLALRDQDFVMAARIAGAPAAAIIGRHLLPSMASYIIVSMTLAVPHMILAETSLSFLGLGLRPPITSWGVLLKEAQNVQTVGIYPWLIMPVFAVILAVLAFNFLGDGIRDAADPYR